MARVKFHAQYAFMSLEEIAQASPERSDPSTVDRNDIEQESLSPPLTNYHTDSASSQDSECSQAPTGGATVAPSQQPSPQYLMSLGIKVRDFAYENTLPAIVPVPRVPRQVQPAPQALKRSHRDWDDKEGPSSSLSSVQPLQGRMATKKPKSLERKATEPLQEPVVQYTRTLERLTVKRVCSMVTPPSRRTLPTTPRTRFSASPPTSPLTPPPLQETDLAQASSAYPFVVRADNAGVTTASKPLQSVSLQPILCTTFTTNSRSSPGRSFALEPPENTPPAPPIGSFVEMPSPSKESGVVRGVRRCRARRMQTPSNRYQLRQRPVLSSRTSTLPHEATTTVKSRPRRTPRHVR